MTHGLADGAAGLAAVRAVVEAALAQVGGKLGEATLQRGAVEASGAEVAHPGGVDEVAAIRQVVEGGDAGGVLALAAVGGEVADADVKIGQQILDQGGLADAGLTEQDGGALRKGRGDAVHALPGGHRTLEDAIADVAVFLQCGREVRRVVCGQVGLVAQDQGLGRQVVHGHEIVVEHVPVGFHAMGDDHRGEVDVGGDAFLPAVGRGPSKQVAAWQDLQHHAVAVFDGFPVHEVAAYGLGRAASSGAAVQIVVVFVLDQHLGAEAGDDAPAAAHWAGAGRVSRYWRSRASTRAAQMKSFRVSPPALWVL